MKKLPKSEHQVIKYIWSRGEGEVSSKDITDYMGESYDWSKGTTSKVLSRLVEKGFLESFKEGRSTIYKVLVGSEEYIKFETEEFFSFVHNGSLKSIVSTLGESNAISEDDIKELEQWIKSR
ncbi:MAG: BlaI/MecI/CopY family transcriptional regulator [Clostridium sp.]|uniref:BlaI/MecI/CopY family transcriptional regulator n=1 Tax=Clostridium sp. TaxID=1506 RepID=UPI002FCCA50D